MLADFRAVHPVATVHLQGLRSEAVEELVQEWPNAPADLVPQLCRLTDGNPCSWTNSCASSATGRRSRARRATCRSRRP